ncbi:hypothetical protein SBDP1_1110002 [Syntrophobacter sp. SbD1]|nr:hypothetical protein SBDP1_1110002 [Syntrophobacter sp. SbD1]
MSTLKSRVGLKKLQTLVCDESIELWALDEVRFQQHGSRCSMWVPPETKDPIMLHHPTREGINYFAAVRIRDGKFIFDRADILNAKSFVRFLKHLKMRSFKKDRRVVVILDNAQYHHAKCNHDWLKTNEPKFSLEFLPPYSPELNPIERV